MVYQLDWVSVRYAWSHTPHTLSHTWAKPVINDFLFQSLIPYAGGYLKKPFSEYLEQQKLKLHTRNTGKVPQVIMSIVIISFGQVIIALLFYLLSLPLSRPLDSFNSYLAGY